MSKVTYPLYCFQAFLCAHIYECNFWVIGYVTKIDSVKCCLEWLGHFTIPWWSMRIWLFCSLTKTCATTVLHVAVIIFCCCCVVFCEYSTIHISILLLKGKWVLSLYGRMWWYFSEALNFISLSIHNVEYSLNILLQAGGISLKYTSILVSSVTQNSYIKILAPSTSECDFNRN